MTRETKIGLLVGLGFIVVFAVLLSNNNPAPPSGDEMLAAADQDENILALGGESVEIDEAYADLPVADEQPEAVASDEPTSLRQLDQALAENTPRDELPAIHFNRLTGSEETADAQADAAAPQDDLEEAPVREETEHFSLETDSSQIVRITQRVAPVAPPPLEPEPAAVEQAEPSAVEDGVEEAPAVEQEKTLPKKDKTPPREYIVQKGDTLWKIAKKQYGTARLQAVEFLAQANDDSIKSKDMVVEGQTLLIPELPADMFEPVRSVDVANNDSLARVEELINKPTTVVDAAHARQAEKPAAGRSAPADFIPVRVPASQQPTSTEVVDASGAGSPRVYTVQPNDTYTKIAEKFLGSKRYWKEIQKLNPKIEPTRMMPGTQIVLPEKDAISTSSNMERTSA